MGLPGYWLSAIALATGGAAYYVMRHYMTTREIEMVADAFAIEGEAAELDDQGQLRAEALVKLVHGLGRRIYEWRGRAITAERKLAQSAKRIENYLKVIEEREQTSAELRQRVHNLSTENQSLKDAEAAHVAELANARERVEAQNIQLNNMALDKNALRDRLVVAEAALARYKKKAKKKS